MFYLYIHFLAASGAARGVPECVGSVVGARGLSSCGARA